MNHLSYIPYTPIELLLSQNGPKILTPSIVCQISKVMSGFFPLYNKILEQQKKKLQKRDVMLNFWRDTICYFEWTRPLIGPR